MTFSTSRGTYTVSHDIPTIATYRHLRVSSGHSDKSRAAIAAGLPNSLFCVQIFQSPSTGRSAPEADDSDAVDPDAVGIGRVIGDGGCFFQIVDIAVLPAHRGCGLGKRIMSELMAWIEENVPETAYISLIADGRAKELYRQYGFVETAPASVGMALVKKGRREEAVQEHA